MNFENSWLFLKKVSFLQKTPNEFAFRPNSWQKLPRYQCGARQFPPLGPLPRNKSGNNWGTEYRRTK
jgi:hypothetical protein